MNTNGGVEGACRASAAGAPRMGRRNKSDDDGKRALSRMSGPPHPAASRPPSPARGEGTESGTPETYTPETRRDIPPLSAPFAPGRPAPSIPPARNGRTMGDGPAHATFRSARHKGFASLRAERRRLRVGPRPARSHSPSPYRRPCGARPGGGEIRRRTVGTSRGTRRISPGVSPISSGFRPGRAAPPLHPAAFILGRGLSATRGHGRSPPRGAPGRIGRRNAGFSTGLAV